MEVMAGFSLYNEGHVGGCPYDGTLREGNCAWSRRSKGNTAQNLDGTSQDQAKDGAHRPRSRWVSSLPECKVRSHV